MGVFFSNLKIEHIEIDNECLHALPYCIHNVRLQTKDREFTVRLNSCEIVAICKLNNLPVSSHFPTYTNFEIARSKITAKRKILRESLY